MEPTTVTCDGTCTVALTVQAAPTSTENINDYNVIYSGFLMAAVTIYLIKRLGRLFSADHERV